jgi:hypothetical protein
MGADPGVGDEGGVGTPECRSDRLGQVERRVTAVVLGHHALPITSGHRFQVCLREPVSVRRDARPKRARYVAGPELPHGRHGFLHHPSH